MKNGTPEQLEDTEIETIMAKTQKAHNNSKTALEEIIKEWDILVRLVLALQVLEDAQDARGKKQALDKYKRSTDKKEIEHEQRWDTYIGLLKTKTSRIGISVG